MFSLPLFTGNAEDVIISFPCIHTSGWRLSGCLVRPRSGHSLEGLIRLSPGRLCQKVWHNVINDDFIIVCLTRLCTFMWGSMYVHNCIECYTILYVYGYIPFWIPFRTLASSCRRVSLLVLSHFQCAELIPARNWSLSLAFVVCFNFKTVLPCLYLCLCVCVCAAVVFPLWEW